MMVIRFGMFIEYGITKKIKQFQDKLWLSNFGFGGK